VHDDWNSQMLTCPGTTVGGSDLTDHQLPALLLAEAFQFIITVIQIYPHSHCIIFDQLLNCRHHLLFIAVHYYSHPNIPSLSLLNFRPVAELQTPFTLHCSSLLQSSKCTIIVTAEFSTSCRTADTIYTSRYCQ